MSENLKCTCSVWHKCSQLSLTCLNKVVRSTRYSILLTSIQLLINKRTVGVCLSHPFFHQMTDCMSSLPSGMCRSNQPWVEQKCRAWHRDMVFPQPVSPSNTPSRNTLTRTCWTYGRISRSSRTGVYTYLKEKLCLEMGHVRGYRADSAGQVCCSQPFSDKRWAPVLAVSP